MFEATGWDFDEPENGENFDEIEHVRVKPSSENEVDLGSMASDIYALSVIRRFEFSS